MVAVISAHFICQFFFFVPLFQWFSLLWLLLLIPLPAVKLTSFLNLTTRHPVSRVVNSNERPDSVHVYWTCVLDLHLRRMLLSSWIHRDLFKLCFFCFILFYFTIKGYWADLFTGQLWTDIWGAWGSSGSDLLLFPTLQPIEYYYCCSS